MRYSPGLDGQQSGQQIITWLNSKMFKLQFAQTYIHILYVAERGTERGSVSE